MYLKKVSVSFSFHWEYYHKPPAKNIKMFCLVGELSLDATNLVEKKFVWSL